MPRRSRRRSRRAYSRRRSSGLALLTLVAGLLLLLVLVQAGVITGLNLPDIRLPITGLPEIQIPQTGIQIPITLVPGTLVPKIEIAGTPVPESALPEIGMRSKNSNCALRGNLPDPGCTPGAVVAATAEQVCAPGYASEAGSVSESRAQAILTAYGVSDSGPGDYRLDHLVPPLLGGSNEDANLWPQPAGPRPGFAEKDALETYLHTEVCQGRMTLSEAQRRIASDWVAAYDQIR